MGGLVGLIHTDRQQQENIAAQLNKMDLAIAHRGSVSHIHTLGTAGGFVLRHRERGAFATAAKDSDRFTVVVDGNITNEPELIEEEGLQKSASSPELIAHLFNRYANEAFQKLDGYFAIVIYFQQSGRLVIARDLFAGRPIFFSLQNNTFLVASEVKAILACNGFKRKINRKLIPQSLTYGLTFGPETLFEDIYKVMPGYVFEGDLKAGMKASFTLTQRPYKKIDKPIGGYGARIWDLLGKNIKRQMGSAKSAGLFLSSGVDSSLVAVKQAEEGFESSLAISCGYTDVGAEEKDESEVARRTAANFNLRFKAVNVSSGDNILSAIRSIICKMDEPTRFAISIPIEKSLDTFKGSFDCLLTGMFADVLYGTEEHYDSPLYDMNKKLPAALRRTIQNTLLLGKTLGIPKFSGWVDMYNRINVSSMKQYILQQSKHSADLHGLVNTDQLPEWAPEIQRIYDNFNFEHGEDEWTLIGTAFFVYCWNELFEILASHAEFDTIHPFVSKETYALSLDMPYKYKIAKTHTKPCLRELAAVKLSPELAYMEKKMFQSPGSIWLTKSEQLKQYLLGLREPTARIKEIMDPRRVDACIDKYQSQLERGRLDEALSRILYSLIGYEIWLEEFFSEDP